MRGVTIDLWDLEFRDLMNLVYAFAVNVTPEAISMQRALDTVGENTTEGGLTDNEVAASVSGSSTVQLTPEHLASSGRTISIQEAIAAGGASMLDDLKAQMEAGVVRSLD